MKDYERFKQVKLADVYKKDEHAGVLERQVDATVFAYLPEYARFPIATSLPISDQSVITRAGALAPFFAGLLPEGHRLTVLKESVKTSLDDEFSLLLAVGQNLPGDISVVPAGEPLEDSVPLLNRDPADLSFDELTNAVDETSIAGVQEKASAHMITSPASLQGQEYILKLSPSRYKGLIANEYEHLQAASAMKIPVVRSFITRDKNKVAGLMVERFDRGSQGERFALEDAAQVLKLTPAQKYSPETVEVIEALAVRTKAPVLARRNLYLQFLYAWLTGNGDLHAKNVSILENTSGFFEIAPVYDVPCTLVYGDKTMALPLMGKTKNIRAKDWLELAGELMIPERAARSAWKTALGAAAQVRWENLPFEGSTLNGVLRELRHRRYELEK